MSAADRPTSKPAPKGPPLGMVKQLHWSIATELGVERVADPKYSKAFADILNDALANKLPSGVTVAPSDTQFVSKPKLLATHLMTARKKPVAAFFVPDEEPASFKGVLALVVRGSNKQTHPRFIKVDDEQLCSAITGAVYTTLPDSAANFHPWFSSLVLNFVDHYGADLHAQEFATATPALVDSRIAIIVMPPLDKKLESTLHKLAIDVAPEKVNAKQLEDHFLKWTQTAMSDSFPRREERLACLKSIVSARVAAAQEVDLALEVDLADEFDELEPAPEPEPAPWTRPPSKKRPTVVDDDEEDDDQSVVKKAKQSGGQRFVSSSMEASSKEDEREARKTAAFETKVQRDYGDSEAEEDKENGDDGDSDSGAKKKKRKSKKKKHSASESSLSSDENNDDSDEDSDEESEEESDEDTEDESTSESSSESEEEPKAKKAKGRLVKTADNMRQTKLVLSKAADSDATAEPIDAPEAAPAAAKKDSRAPVYRRANVASQCQSMLNSVEACVGVPLGQTEHVQKLVADLREAYKLYGSSEGGKVGDSYSLHTKQAELTSALVAALNATLTEGQRSEDAAASRRLAVSSTKALVTVLPWLEDLKAKVDQFLSVDAKKIEEDMSQSSASIPAAEA